MRLWAETTAQTTSSYGGCDPTLGHTQTLTRALEQACAVWALSHPCGSIPGGTQPASPRPPTHRCSSAPIWDQGEDVQAAQDLCPWSFYQRHGWAWTPQGWGGHVQYVEGFLGPWEG